MNSLNVSDKAMKIRKVLRARGIGGTLRSGVQYFFPPKALCFGICKELVNGRLGLEIGGPSGAFRRTGYLPIYQFAGGIDNCNFGAETIWETGLSEGKHFEYDQDRPKGHQYIAEATDLKTVPDGTYDFVLSCHSIEHTANPIRAVREWMRVLKDDGGLILIVPHKEDTFDDRRPTSTLSHIIDDYQKNTGEDDTTHVAEVLKFHNLDKDWGCADHNALVERTRNNLQNRGLHHHAFNTPLVVDTVDYAGMQILSVEALRPFHIIVVARKLMPGKSFDNTVFRSSAAPWRRQSPFKIDH